MVDDPHIRELIEQEEFNKRKKRLWIIYNAVLFTWGLGIVLPLKALSFISFMAFIVYLLVGGTIISVIFLLISVKMTLAFKRSRKPF